MNLPSWRKVMTPQREIRDGNLKNSSFAANLVDLDNPNAESEYREPEKFFNRTFLTDGLKKLLIATLKRVSNLDGDPVIQLKTSFGGGKTHSLLAIYHLFVGRNDLLRNEEIRKMIESIGLEKIPDDVRIAKLVGTATNQPRIWEYIAEQLTDDETLLSKIRGDRAPGSIAFRELFDSCGACVILIDELVAYARNFYKDPEFDKIMTFVQSITEAATSSARSVVVVSLPESEIEYGGEGGSIAAKHLAHIFQRLNVVWNPVTMEESFSIVRQRLFETCVSPEIRKQICDSFANMYFNQSKEFPAESVQEKYRVDLESCYPIHPQIFYDLFERWSTAFSNFQRTRGVLRFMANVIANLWKNNDPNCMIMPGSIPFNDSKVSHEILKCFGESENIWQSIVQSEIEKPHEFVTNHELSEIDATRRTARAVFLATAPTGRGSRGITKYDVHLATMFPEDKSSVFNEALSDLKENLVYFYANDTLYWFDSRATVQKRVKELESKIDDGTIIKRIESEAWKRLKTISKPRTIFPKNPSDVPIPREVILIILPATEFHSSGDLNSKAINRAKFIHLHQKQLRNLMLFLAADDEELNKIESIAATLIAWEMVESESEHGVLNLDTQQKKEVQKGIDSARKSLDSNIQNLYRFVLSPKEDKSTHKIDWSDVEIKTYLLQTIKDQEWLFEKLTPRKIKEIIEEFYPEHRISIDQLWNDLSNFTYMPRLLNREVLDTSIRNGNFFVEDEVLYLEPPQTSEPEVEEVEVVEEKIPDQIEESESKTQPVVERKKKNFNFKTSCKPKDLKNYISKIDSNIIQNLPDGVTGIVTIELDVHFADGFSDEDQSILSDESKKLNITFKLN